MWLADLSAAGRLALSGDLRHLPSLSVSALKRGASGGMQDTSRKLPDTSLSLADANCASCPLLCVTMANHEKTSCGCETGFPRLWGLWAAPQSRSTLQQPEDSPPKMRTVGPRLGAAVGLGPGQGTPRERVLAERKRERERRIKGPAPSLYHFPSLLLSSGTSTFLPFSAQQTKASRACTSSP